MKKWRFIISGIVVVLIIAAAFYYLFFMMAGVKSSTYLMKNQDTYMSSKVVDSNPGAPGTTESGDGNGTLWKISKDGKYYKIESLVGLYCLQTDTNDEGDLVLSEGAYAGLDKQQWKITKTFSGYKITSKASNKSITLKGTKVILGEGSGWKFEEKIKMTDEEKDTYLQNVADSASPSAKAIADSWVVTDSLGRTLPEYKEIGDYRKAKYVGMFYWTWHGDGAGSKVYDMTKSINEAEDMSKFKIATMEEYFWGEPEDGYYNGSDMYVHLKNLIMMGNAGIDFIYLDYTNAVWHKGIDALMKAYEYARDNNISVPKFVFFFNTKSDEMLDLAYKNIYSKEINKDMWFMWEGKPLIMSPPTESSTQKDVINNFFTFRKTWAFDVSDGYEWNFIDNYPQKYSYTTDPTIPEYIPVTKSLGAPLTLKSIGTEMHGSSYNWVEPEKSAPINDRWYTDDTGKGIAFSQFWQRALYVDPLIVGVTGWNELIARAWAADDSIANNYTFMGKDLKVGDPDFVDEFNWEFNRDIEPMKGGYTDSYYYQLISFIRQFKGMSAPETTMFKSNIAIDGNFDDWNSVEAKFFDAKGDTLERNANGYLGAKQKYTNDTGRNDFVSAKVAFDDQNVYFMVETAQDITAYTDNEWMLLFIDSDKNHDTGWEGYDYVINKSVIDGNKTTLMKWNGTDWDQISDDIDYAVSQNKAEIKIPQSMIDFKEKDGFYFKFADNVQGMDNLENFFTNGDTAPDRRFSYEAKIVK